MGFKLGQDAKIYRLTTGTRAAWPSTEDPANLAEITNVRDVTVNMTKSEADATTRGSGGWKQTVAALKDASVDFEMVWDDADTHFEAIKDSFVSGNAAVALAILDGVSDTAGTQGLWADFMVTGFEKGEPLEGVQMVKVTVKPTYSAVAPQWVTVVDA